MTGAVRTALHGLSLFVALPFGVRATDPPARAVRRDTVPAAVEYVERTHPLPAEDDRQLARRMDSLFILGQVPYASPEGPRMVEDAPAEATLLDWYGDGAIPHADLYGAWITDNPNAYGPELSAADNLLLLRLTDEATHCGFAMPVPGAITSRFGKRDGRHHNGIDLDLRTGQPVESMFPGVVRFAGTYGGFGRLVVVRHYNGLETFYAHLHRVKVAAGDVVDAGQTIGLGGSTGRSTGPHLHLEARFKGVPIDPSRFIDLASGELACDTLVLRRTPWGYAAYPQGTVFHTVRKGDHLYGIAGLYGTSINALCELNGITRRTVIRVGQQLMVARPAALATGASEAR